MSEVWAPIPGYPNYEASTLGRIRSIDRTIVDSRGQVRNMLGRILKPVQTPTGYLKVAVDGDTKRVHHLVASTFIGPMPEGQETRHLNGIAYDNRAVNLSYATHSENCRDKRTHGTDPQVNKTHCPQGHEYTPENTYIEKRSNRNVTARQCRTCRNTRSNRTLAHAK